MFHLRTVKNRCGRNFYPVDAQKWAVGDEWKPGWWGAAKASEVDRGLETEQYG
jgi:hypothetical protein